jgi:DNA-binding NarL/FixJ family response regulator
LIRIVIADDHELIREGIRKIIRPQKDIQIVADAADLAQTMQMTSEHAPDMLILDISLPECDGLEGLEEVRRRFPHIPVLILSMYAEERFAIRALKAGASGYITKGMAAEELIKAIRKIMSGGTYVSARLAELLASNVRQPVNNYLHHSLTERELQVVSMLGAGKQIKQIAAELSISISTVNTYRIRVFRKLGLTSNAAVIRYAVEHQLVG